MSVLFAARLKKLSLRYRWFVFFFPIALAAVVLTVPLPANVPGIVYFVGRFHPLVIHFPIALAPLALVLICGAKLKLWRMSEQTVCLVIGFALAGGIVSATHGLFLYYTNEYSGPILMRHLWGGVSFTAALALCFYFYIEYYRTRSRLFSRLFFIFLVGSNVVLGYASHQGGSLTHGGEYLTEYIPKFVSNDTWKPKPREEMLVYDDLIIPIFDQKCLSCHNQNKMKGDLLMTSLDGLLRGGKSGKPAVMAGSLAGSEAYRRISLPSADDDHMPPDGKPGLTDDEATLFAWWIEHGADAEVKAATALADTQYSSFINAYITRVESQQETYHVQQQNVEKLIKTVSRENYLVEKDPCDKTAIWLSMTFPVTRFGDDDLPNLSPVFPRITKASFMGSDITDDGLYYVGQMTSLRELYLQSTGINGAGLVHLKDLHGLTLLDFSKSHVTNGQLLHVIELRSLKDLYLYECRVSKDVIDAIRENRPDLNIHLERGKLF